MSKKKSSGNKPAKDQETVDDSALEQAETVQDEPAAATDEDQADRKTGKDKDETTEVLATDEDPVQIGDATAIHYTETRAGKPIESADAADPVSAIEPPASKSTSSTATKPPAAKRGFPWFGLLNFLLIVALAAAA